VRDASFVLACGGTLLLAPGTLLVVVVRGHAIGTQSRAERPAPLALRLLPALSVRRTRRAKGKGRPQISSPGSENALKRTILAGADPLRCPRTLLPAQADEEEQ
jgi:hypothetical protein